PATAGLRSADCSAHHPLLPSVPTRRSSDLDYGEFDVSCNGESDATLRARASFGTGPYTYNWSTGDNTETIQNVGAGEYSVQVTRSEEHTSELQSRENLVCRLLLEKKRKVHQ